MEATHWRGSSTFLTDSASMILLSVRDGEESTDYTFSNVAAPEGGFRAGHVIATDLGAGPVRLLVRRAESVEELDPDGTIVRRWRVALEASPPEGTGSVAPASLSGATATPLGEEALRAALRRYAAADREDAEYDATTETVTWRDGPVLVSAPLSRVRSAMVELLTGFGHESVAHAVVSLEHRGEPGTTPSAPGNDATAADSAR